MYYLCSHTTISYTLIAWHTLPNWPSNGLTTKVQDPHKTNHTTLVPLPHRKSTCSQTTILYYVHALYSCFCPLSCVCCLLYYQCCLLEGLFPLQTFLPRYQLHSSLLHILKMVAPIRSSFSSNTCQQQAH